MVILLALLLSLGALALVSAQSGAQQTHSGRDYNGDDAVGFEDVLSLLLRGRADPAAPELDYNADGVYSTQDALDFLLDLMWGRLAPYAVVVTPRETDELLLNPGMGFVSVESFNNWVRQFRHPLCSIAQFRWYWKDIEPQEGQIDFALIDRMIELGTANGQKIMLRVMCQDGVVDVPQWLIDQGLKGQSYTEEVGWQPDYSSALFYEKHANLIRALAARYDGTPYLDHVDIGTVGRWAEWHTSGTGLNMPPDSILRKFVDLYLDNFKKTPLVMQIGGAEELKYAVEKGTGWRADCLGDYGMFSPTWNHMEDFYQQALDAEEANEAWRNGPVVFESCGSIQTWYDDHFDIDKILSEALRWHASVVHLGTVPVPDAWWDKVVEFGRKMGYRFVLERLSHPATAKAGGSLYYEMEWENKGVAPCYLKHPLAFELRNRQSGASWVVDTGADIRNWLPGPVEIRSRIELPADMPPGEYELGLAFLDPWSREPRIALPLEVRATDGWYRLSHVTIH